MEFIGTVQKTAKIVRQGVPGHRADNRECSMTARWCCGTMSG